MWYNGKNTIGGGTMIIRDDSAKSGDKHEQDKARSNGEELKIDLGRDLTEDEQKIFEKLRAGLNL